MLKVPTLTPRQYLIVAHDLFVTALAILASFFIRFEGGGLAERLDWLLRFLPGFVVYAGFIYLMFGLHASKWRFTSLPDLSKIARASAVLALSLLVLDYILVSPQVYGAFFFGKITIALYWFVQMAFLAGSRIAYRQFRYVRTQQHARFIFGSLHDFGVLGLHKDSQPVILLMPIFVVGAEGEQDVVVLRLAKGAADFSGDTDDFVSIGAGANGLANRIDGRKKFLQHIGTDKTYRRVVQIVAFG